MGWQSYVAYFDTTEKYNRIIELIKSHNNYDGELEDLVGEELMGIVKCKIIKPNNHYGHTKCILFGHGGGRDYTFKYFKDRGVPLKGFIEQFEKDIEDKSLWEEIKI